MEASTESGTATTASTETPQAWHSSFDHETSGWLENRGLTKLDEKAAIPELVKGFRNAEKFVGTPADKLVKIPNWDTADKVELDQVYNKLGRPADPKDYGLKVPEGEGREFADWAQGLFHEAGLSTRQASKIAEKWNEYIGSAKEGDTTAKQESLKTQEAGLRQEWGDAFDKYDTIAANAISSLGIKDNQLAALRDSLGFDGAMKMFASIGEKMGEAEFHTGERSNSGPMTPQQAVAKLTQLQQDKEWVNKYFAGNAEAKAEMSRLQSIAFPGNITF
jgi:hypothetical protein